MQVMLEMYRFTLKKKELKVIALMKRIPFFLISLEK
jgi:hypothetical protein